MTLDAISEISRVPLRRDSCGDRIIAGRNGHLYTDNGMVMLCFTDDGRAKPFPGTKFKTYRLQILRPYVIRLQQEGDYEFIAGIEPTREAITAALFRVLGVIRFRATKGVPRLPEHRAGLFKPRSTGADRSLETITGGREESGEGNGTRRATIAVNHDYGT